MGTMGGLYLLYAALAARAGYAYGYSKHEKNRLGAMSSAMKQRAAQRASENPPDLHLVPEPVEADDEIPKPIK